MRYEQMEREQFDAVVTGELTHFAIWMEDEINRLITNYFVGDQTKANNFRRLILRRDGLTFQDKLEVARGMISLLGLDDDGQKNFKRILRDVERFKSWRNAMAHGRDVTADDDEGRFLIEMVSRSGKERVYELTAHSHRKMMDEAEVLHASLRDAVSAGLAPENGA